MNDPLRTDLDGAQQIVAVELHLTTGEKLLTGLHFWPPEDEGGGFWFSVNAPRTRGDTTTTRKVFRDQVNHWIDTDVSYRMYD